MHCANTRVHSHIHTRPVSIRPFKQRWRQAHSRWQLSLPRLPPCPAASQHRRRHFRFAPLFLPFGPELLAAMTTQRKTDIEFLLNRVNIDNNEPRSSSPGSSLPLLPPAISVQPQEPPVSGVSSFSSLPFLRNVAPSPPPLPPSLPGLGLIGSTTPSTIQRALGPPASAPYYRNPLFSFNTNALQMRPSGQMYTTRRKLADPKTSAMDPELNKRRYLCNYPNCGNRFKQRGGKSNRLLSLSTDCWRGVFADLKKHIRVVHKNERNFVCKTCNKCFGERG